MEKTHVFSNPFKYFKWKAKLVIHMRSKFLHRVTMGLEVEPNSAMEKWKYFNRLDEAFGIICLSISRDFIFNVESMIIPN